MSSLLAQLEAWHWFVLVFLLLVIEALGAGGFLVGAAVAALALAIITLVVDISWQLQITFFALLSIFCSILYWKFFKTFNNQTDAPDINQRAEQLIGRRIVLSDDIVTGQGKVQMGDTFWKVETAVRLKKGDVVEVFAAQDMTLQIKPVAD